MLLRFEHAEPDQVCSKRGQPFHLAVGLKPGAAQPDDKEVIAFCRARLARFKVPKTFVYGPLPKTAAAAHKRPEDSAV